MEMVLPYYFVFENGQAKRRDPQTFKLHDSRAEFAARPRVFTTLVAEKTTDGYDATRLADHIERLLDDATAFELVEECPEHNAEWIRAQLAQHWTLADERLLRIRLVLSRSGLELYLDPFAPRWKSGTPIALASYRGMRPWPEQKTTATAISRAAHDHALRNDALEALLLDDSGAITEGSWSNFFWSDSKGEIFTRKDGVLPGITRRTVLDRMRVTFRTVTLEEFFDTACEAFITQSSHGITPVGRVDTWTAKTGALDEHLLRA